MDWRTVEVLGYAHFTGKGYRILVSLVDNNGYDFVAERGGQFVRVNVKLAGFSNGGWRISLSGRRRRDRPTVGEVDVYLAYVPTLQRFIELPGDFLQHGKSRRIPSALLNGAP